MILSAHCLIVADDALVRAGLRALIESSLITCSTSDLTGAADQVGHDVIVLHLDSASGAESLTAQLGGEVPIVVTSAHHEAEVVLDVLAAGTLGFVAHVDLGPIELTSAVTEAVLGRQHVSPAAASVLLTSLRATADGVRPTPSDQLSRREIEVMTLVAEGGHDLQVASTLGIAVKTVQNHLQAIYVKHDLHSRGEAVAWWTGRLATDPVDWVMGRDNYL